MRRLRNFIVLLAVLLVSSSLVAADKVDADVQRLQTQLDQLEAEASLAGLAGLERLKARQALDALRSAKSRDRSHAVFVAERRIETAQVTAQVELLRRQSQQLDREYDQLQIEISRRDAEMARRENERLRLQSLAREEEAQRLLETERMAREAQAAATAAAEAEAEQARRLAAARAREAELARREAELASAVMLEAAGAAPPPKRVVGNAEVYTLAGNAFASGSANLTAEARASLRALAVGLASGSGSILIEGHSDSQGEPAANLALSKRRADAVLKVLAEAGVGGSRLRAEGRGQDQPVADNSSAAGRAQNRRVEIIVK